MDWNNEEIENIKRLVFKENLCYEEVGRRYNCSGANIKKRLACRGIKLPIRSKNTGKEPHNKGLCKRYFCESCGKELIKTRNTKHKFCSNKCQQEYTYKKWAAKYKNDNSIAKTNKYGKIPPQLRRYIFEKYDVKCCQCGWSEKNKYTNTIPLEIDHINGNANDNSESNLRLICPNCHSLTSTYRGSNRGHGRNITWIVKS